MKEDISNICWEMVDEKAYYNFTYKGEKIIKLIPDINGTPLLGNDEPSKEWIWKNYGNMLTVMGF